MSEPETESKSEYEDDPLAQHLSVLSRAVLEALGAVRPLEVVVDGTCGLGGHSEAILDAFPESRLLGIDRDPFAVDHASARLRRFGDRAAVRLGCFGEWLDHLRRVGVEQASGLLLDLGVSSPQLDRAERGFSFRHEAPLDMRMNQDEGESALDKLRDASEDEIARVLRDYGEERFAGRIARRIRQALEAERLSTTSSLAAICRSAYPRGRHRIDPATRTFQALRIWVNDELGELERALDSVPRGLATPGVVCVISFHSLEDRIVKQTFRRWESDGLGRPLKKRPLTADEAECAQNPRARSAKLRAFMTGATKPEKQYRSKRHRLQEDAETP